VVFLWPLQLPYTSDDSSQLKCISSSGISVSAMICFSQVLGGQTSGRYQLGIGNTPSVVALAMEKAAEAGTNRWKLGNMSKVTEK